MQLEIFKQPSTNRTFKNTIVTLNLLISICTDFSKLKNKQMINSVYMHAYVCVCIYIWGVPDGNPVRKKHYKGLPL